MLIHKTKVQVRFGDTDPYGVVYFVAYFRYFHQGIEEFLRYIDISPETFFRNKKEKYGMPKVAANCSFLAPAYYGDLLEMHTSIKEIKEKAIVFQSLCQKLSLKKYNECSSNRFMGNPFLFNLNSKFQSFCLNRCIRFT